MDDGYKLNKNMVYSTDGFKKEDVELLRKVLLNKFTLETSIHTVRNNQYRIYIKTNSMKK